MRFKKDAIIKCIKNVVGYKTKGLIGRIIIVDRSDNEYPYGIEFDKYIDSREDCWECGEYGYSLWVGEDDIIPYNSKQRIK